VSNIGWVELLVIIAVVAVLFFVPKRLPQLARSLGKSIRSFKKGLKASDDEVQTVLGEVKDASGAEELKSAVAEIREEAGVKGILPGKKRSTATSPEADASNKSK
jgi:TatA/E family protein of Tat protein translocase